MPEIVARVTYAQVAQNLQANPAVLREHDGKLDAFLLKHVSALRNLAAGKNACPATFFDPAGEALFDDLKTGSDNAFLKAAHELTTRLIKEMTGATKPGLLVCMQVKDGQTLSAAVLKLQIVQPNAASLETLDTGEVLLSAVINVMNAPGELQKGALVDDPRVDSDIAMGDVANKEAHYFPRAFGISIDQRPAQAAADTLGAIGELQGSEVQAAARKALPTIPPGKVADVLAGIAQTVPELKPPEVRESIAAYLADRPRPVRNIDTAAPLIEHIEADSISIKVPLGSRDRVRIERDPEEGGYVITIRVDEEPRRTLQ